MISISLIFLMFHLIQNVKGLIFLINEMQYINRLTTRMKVYQLM